MSQLIISQLDPSRSKKIIEKYGGVHNGKSELKSKHHIDKTNQLGAMSQIEIIESYLPKMHKSDKKRALKTIATLESTLPENWRIEETAPVTKHDIAMNHLQTYGHLRRIDCPKRCPISISTFDIIASEFRKSGAFPVKLYDNTMTIFAN